MPIRDKRDLRGKLGLEDHPGQPHELLDVAVAMEKSGLFPRGWVQQTLQIFDLEGAKGRRGGKKRKAALRDLDEAQQKLIFLTDLLRLFDHSVGVARAEAKDRPE